MKIYGFVMSGKGVGRKYVGSEPYVDFFRRILKCEVYPGTLNIRVDENTIQQFLDMAHRADFDGNAGGLNYWIGEIEGEKCVLVIPEKTEHKNVIEIVSCKNLRDCLEIKDGDIVEITCSTQHPSL